MEWDVRRGQNSNDHWNHGNIEDLDDQSHDHYDGCRREIILILIIIKVIINVIMIVIKVMDGVADFCIADISITSPRAKAFTFSMPWFGQKIALPHPCLFHKCYQLKNFIHNIIIDIFVSKMF